MLIGLLTLAYILFSGANETFLLNPELKKDVSIYVKDKERKKEIDSLIKYVEKTEKRFQKRAKNEYKKKFDELNMNRASTRDQFKLEYDQFYTDLRVVQNDFIESELKFRTHIKQDEWEKIMARVLQEPDKEKTRKRLLEENKKLHDKLLTACQKRIPDQAGKAKAKALVDEYEKKGAALDIAYLDLNYRNLKAIRPYKVNRSDFDTIRSDMIELRRSYTSDLVEMRFRLIALTPEKEWKGLARELNEGFNYLGAGITK